MVEDVYRLGVKALIRDVRSRILLLKVNPAELHGAEDTDYWDLPGGRVQQGSNVRQTLKREVEEEIGISDVTIKQPLGMVVSPLRIPVGDHTVGLILSVYECAPARNIDIKLSKEHIAYDWFTPKTAAEKLSVKYPSDFCELIAQL